MREDTRQDIERELNYAARSIARQEKLLLKRKVRLDSDLEHDLEVRQDSEFILLSMPEDGDDVSAARLLRFLTHGVRAADLVDYGPKEQDV